MSVNFEKNAYLSAVKEKPHFNRESEIFDHIRTRGLQFKYADVKVKEFNQKYSAKGWFGRKVVALPSAIWSGIVKTIYHLVNSKYLKAQLFYIARDLQESFGWLATLLDDRYGQHHIQESGFHKSCYDCFLSNNIPQPDSPQQGNTNTSYHQAYSSSKTPTPRTAVPLTTPWLTTPLTTPWQNSPKNQTRYRQNEFHSTLTASYLASDGANFRIKENQPSDKQSVINRMMRDPSGFPNLNYGLKNDEDVVAAALSGCRNAEQAKKVINNANYNAKNSKKVVLALLKIDLTQFEQLNYNVKNDEDVVAAALDGCRNAE